MGLAFQRHATPIAHSTPDAAIPAPGGSAPASPVPPTQSRRACDWLLQWYDRHRFLYLAVLVLFYLAGFNGTWRPEPDSALYLSIGRNLAEGDGYTYNGMPHALAYPGMPYLHALLFRVTGLHSEWPALAVMLAFSLAALGLMYRLFLLHAGRPAAVVLTCMAGMTYSLYHYAFELRNEIPFLVGVLAFLVGWEAWMQARRAEPRRLPAWYDNVLLITGLALAIVMRPHMWVLLLAALGALLIAATRSRRRGRIFAGMLAVAALGGGLLMLDPRGEAHLSGTYEGALAQTLSNLWSPEGAKQIALRLYELLGRDIAEAAFGHELGPGLTLIAGLALAALSLQLIRRRAIWGLFVAGTFFMMLLAPASMPRYLLPILPLMAIAWWSALVRLNHRLPLFWGNVVFVLLMTVWVAPNFLRISKTLVEQRYPPLERSYAVNQSLRGFATHLAAQVQPGTQVLAHRRIARVLAYWSDRRVSADYEMNRNAVPRFVVWPADEHVVQRLAELKLQPGSEVAAVGDPAEPQTHFSLRRVAPAPPVDSP